MVMIRLTRWVVAALVVGLVVPAAFSQRGGFRGGMGRDGVSLLTQKSVQEELKLSDEQKKKVEELASKQRENFKGFKDLSEEERKQKFQERSKASKEEVAKILNQEQQKRFKQISLQLAGSRAFSDPEVVDALKLTDEQKEKIKGIQEDSFKEMREAFQGDREEARKKMESIRKSADEKAQGVLTQEQKTKWKDMTGAAFTGKLEFQGRPGGKKKKSDN
jgi:Spy/CpxP family protein refolding chaperone